MNDAPEILTFHDSDGNPADFEYIGTVEHEGSYYLLLHPVEAAQEPEDDTMEIMILKLTKDENGQDSFLTVEDNDLFNQLIDLYNSMDEVDAMDLASILGEEEGQDDETV